MDWLFKTSAVVILGGVLALIVVISLISQKRSKEINLLELGSVFFSSSSFIGGLKLILATFKLLDDQLIESDKLYIIYGGFCVIYISTSSLVQKIRRPGIIK